MDLLHQTIDFLAHHTENCYPEGSTEREIPKYRWI